MNILIDDIEYPVQAQVNEKKYEIRTNFRTSILFEMMIQDSSLDDGVKVRKALDLYYPVIPDDLEAAIDTALWFYRCGREETAQQKRAASRRGKSQIYSFEHDAGYIYAAFLSVYGIDLQDINYMHWWKFRFLFQSLPKDTEFVRIMEYRSMDINDKMPKEQKDFYKRMKCLYALPLSNPENDRQAAIENALLNGGDLSGVL